MSGPTQNRKNTLERVLSIVAEVRQGEGTMVLLMATGIFLLVMSFVMVKIMRTTLVIVHVGAAMKTYAAAIQSVVLAGLIYGYAWLARHLVRRRLVRIVSAFVAVFLVVLATLFHMFEGLFIVFYILGGVVGVVLITLFWSYATDIYTPEQGKRLFVLLGLGASAGGVSGAIAARTLLEHLSVLNIVVGAAGLLILSLVCANLVETRRGNGSSIATAATPPAAIPVSEGTGPFRRVWQNKYLLTIAAIVLLTNVVGSTGEYILNKSLEVEASEKAALGEAAFDPELYIGKFYSMFYLTVSVVGLLLQMLVVSRVLKHLGVTVAIMVLPVIALGGYLWVSVLSAASVIAWIRLGEVSTDTSLNSTARHILFLPTTREDKYVAKMTIDSLVMRSGDVLAALLIFLGATYLSFSVRQFAVVNVCLSAAWLFLAYRAGTTFRDLAAQGHPADEGRV